MMTTTIQTENSQMDAGSCSFLSGSISPRTDEAPGHPHSDSFLRTIQDAAVAPDTWGGDAEDLASMGTTSVAMPTRDATETVCAKRLRIVFRATEDWKRRGELDHLIGLLQDSAEIRCGEKMARRVRALRQMALEEGDTEMGTDSLRSFFEFLTLNPRLKYPEISLTPDGDIYARWKGPQKMLLSIHFLPESRVRYVLFAPDRRRPALINRASGTDSVYGVFQTAARFLGPTDWLVQ